MDKKQLLLIAAGASIATVIGAFLPWATFDGEGLGAALAAVGQSASVSGIEGDGVLVLILALVGGAVAGAAFLGKSLPISGKKAMLTGAICMAVASLICVINVFGMSGMVSVGFGLYLCLAGSIAATSTTFLVWKKMGGELPTAVGGQA